MKVYRYNKKVQTEVHQKSMANYTRICLIKVCIYDKFASLQIN